MDAVDTIKEEKQKKFLNAMIGAPCPRTMRMVGRIIQVVVIILVDIGNTHNFMDPNVAKRAMLVKDSKEKMEVKLLMGTKLRATESIIVS